jgi:hypothetical protein
MTSPLFILAIPLIMFRVFIRVSCFNSLSDIYGSNFLEIDKQEHADETSERVKNYDQKTANKDSFLA